MKVLVSVPGMVEHGKPVRHFYSLENTGGYDITDVVVVAPKNPDDLDLLRAIKP
jgi:hypothetical protein